MISPINSSSRINPFAAPVDGIRRAITQAGAASEKLADGEITPENMVALLEAKALVKANAASIRTADEIRRTLLDETA